MEDGRAQERLVVVGIGASGTAIDSLERFLAHVPEMPDVAVVVALQQRQLVDEARQRTILARAATLTPALVAEEAPVEPGRIYLLPEDRTVTLAQGRFRLGPAAGPDGRGSLDSFLVSIGADREAGAVAVVLAGTGSDGTLGVTAIKEAGGLTLAEPQGEEGPSASTAGALADHVVPPEQMADRILSYLRHLRRTALPARDAVDESASEWLIRIATILRNKTGHDFHGYKQNTFLRRVHRRMQVVQVETVEAYVEHLRTEPDEVQNLFNDLLIGVTQFFRDGREFELLESEVIPRLFAGKGSNDQVRVWVLGCATGEEAYSIGILLREHMATLDAVPQVQIFATDIDGRALASARVGRYTEALARQVRPDRLARWFVKEGATYSVVKELREMCIFSQHNVIKDAPFSRLDLVSCRNLLIYLNGELQNRVIPLFHFALRPGGFLFLGNSENVTRHAKLFSAIDRRYRIFRRLESATRVLPEFPLTVVADRRLAESGGALRPRAVEGSLARRAEQVAERYAPAYVVVDEAYDVLHFSGRTGRYIDPATGAASLNLLNLVHRDLRLDLRAALLKAGAEHRTVKAERTAMGSDGERRLVTLVVEPVPGTDNPPSFVILFQEGETLESDGTEEPTPSFLRDEHVQRLESELRLTRERLQATIEELESTNEELKSSNEEYQSINEELQSANEELETSKEELQSVNEELQTVNGELGHRVNDLGRANSDLKNLLESTQIATVFLDNEFRVKNFTPAVTDIFHLIDSDLGRPITHIAARILYPELPEDVRKVLRTLGTIEREVGNPETGSRYLARVLPYRSIDNFIAGVVITFLDITATARAERALRESQERFRRMERIVPAFLFTADAALHWLYVNPRFYEHTGLEDGKALGLGWLSVLHPDDVEENQRRWQRAVARREPFEHEFRIRSTAGTYRWFTARAEPMADPDGAAVTWFGSCTDSHERRMAEDRQRLLLAELQHRVKNILAVVRSVANRTAEGQTSLADFVMHFDGRLGALARTQNILTRSPDAATDLAELIGEEVLSHAVRDGSQVTLDGPEVRLPQKTAETLGLVLHELATNAIKYGALARPEGRIAIAWRLYGDGTDSRLRLEWQESGVTLLPTAPARRGFGRELIEQGLVYEFGATTALEYRPGGVRCVIELPVQVFQAPSGLAQGQPDPAWEADDAG
ncbi:PAS domain S-box protein [Methylobacterium terricola]|uniref:Blue-light-activated histidine kinase n=1 Tax=Methylobacterium terricola TaxID=2583531 RepID=A0A5C4L7T4_9HYPH|nr:CheR family methyltransferase [Methylobacterium terricola]TNC05709.1 PAS domain S-box protein [Methylobacterium terricola]